MNLLYRLYKMICPLCHKPIVHKVKLVIHGKRRYVCKHHIKGALDATDSDCKNNFGQTLLNKG